MKDMFQLCDEVRQIAYDIHEYHGNGYVEKVYEFQIKKYVLSDTLRRKSPNRLTTFLASVFFAFSALFCG